MGVDCDIYAFPKGRLPRFKELDRYWPLIELLEGRCPDRAWDTPTVVDLMAAVLSEPVIESVHGYEASYVDHWRAIAFEFCKKVFRRFGPETPVMIVSEEDETVERMIAENCPAAMRRLDRNRSYAEAVRQRAREAENRRAFEHVKRELAAKRARQWE